MYYSLTFEFLFLQKQLKKQEMIMIKVKIILRAAWHSVERAS